ncbi:MAG: thiol-disulfide oxidoreductase DCC family protein [Acidimicrobiia bacterium]
MTSESVLLYDGDCGICTRLMQWTTRHAHKPFHALDANTLSSAELAQWQLTEAEVRTASYWINADGHVFRGSAGIARVLGICGQPWAAVGFAMRIPGITWIAAVGYRIVARNRHRFPGSTCELPTRPMDGRA